MNTFAFLLDGDWHFAPPLPIELAAYLAPILTLAACVLIIVRVRFVVYGYTLAAVAAAFYLVPLYRLVLNTYVGNYTVRQSVLFWYLIAFPFVATAAFHVVIRRRTQNASIRSSTDITPSDRSSVKHTTRYPI